MSPEPGDVVLVRFIFSNGDYVGKRRPAVVVSSPAYHRSRADAIICALTGNLDSDRFGDYVLQDWKEAGLGMPSKSKAAIQTVEQAAIAETLGHLSSRDYEELLKSLRRVLALT